MQSGTVRWVGYDLADSVLEVGFVSGSVYRYLDVPPDAALALLESDSIGRYLNREIKPRYSCEPVSRAG